MLNACFYFLVSMSISSSVVIGVLLLVRQIKVIPKRWIYPLWSIALLRMVVPVAVSSSISIFNSVRDLLETRMPVRTVVFTDATAAITDNAAADSTVTDNTVTDFAGAYDHKDDFDDSLVMDTVLTARNCIGFAEIKESIPDIIAGDSDKEVILSVFNYGGYADIKNDNRDITAMTSGYPNVVAMSQYYYPLQYKTHRLTRIFNIGTFIWITGVLFLLFIIYILYVILFYQYKRSFHLKENIYNNVNASSPFLLGIMKPKIILPTDLDVDSLQASHIISHEKVHVKRRDNLWRLVGLIATCLHWFNPVAWIGYSCFLKDMEFSCDEIVIKNYTGSSRKEYAQALLSVGERTHGQNPIPAAFGKTSTGSRIMSVLTFQKLSWLGTFGSVLFLLIIAAMLMTNARV